MLLLPLVIPISFLLASPVLSASPTSVNDAFRAIAAQVPRRTDPPVCCLKPLQPIDSMEDELLLSFEDWKQRQFAVQEKERAQKERGNNRSAHTITTKESSVNLNRNDTDVYVQEIYNASYSGDVEHQPARNPENEPLPPHFRVPLTDRFNYASIECSARVHLANRLAKSSSSILSSKRDRYMLSPCNPPNKEKQFVVVELCEDIRIDTVQLANFEFFSGIFKDFRISVAKTHTTREDAWTDVGFFRAKNVRGVQSFHPPRSLRDFYRYIRIEFLTHYGNEYYCPVSLLRVYGLTHLEQWKWDTWEQESRDKLDASADEAQALPTSVIGVASSTILESVFKSPNDDNDSGAGIGQNLSKNSEMPTKAVVQEGGSRSTAVNEDGGFHLSAWKLFPSGASTQLSHHDVTSSNSEAHVPTSSHHEPNLARTTSLATDSSSTSTSLHSDSASSTAHHSHCTTSLATHMPSPDNSSINNPIITSKTSQNHVSQAVTSTSAVTSTTITTTTTSIAVVSSISPHPVPSTTGGESIYKTIMNRLTALEANNTLYTRYVEQQTGAVREVLKRLMEDVGRLEGIGKGQNLVHQRTLHAWEQRQQQLQMEYGVLMARIEYLADEIVLEKRLGIAQLCLLLAVLVFMGLTRGSRGDAAQPVSVREWGRRHLSLSGDWSKHFGRGRSRDMPKPHSAAAWSVPLNLDVEDDLKSSCEDKRIPLQPLRVNARSLSSGPRVPSSLSRAKSRSRTPSMRNGVTRPHQYILPKPPSTPTNANLPRPQLQRSSSQTGAAGSGGGTGPHKSTKKWARTAHLHEVRSVERRRARVDSNKSRAGGGGHDENETVEGQLDPFWVNGDGGNKESSVVKGGVRSGIKTSDEKRLEEGEGDGWVDTDFEGEDGDIWKLQRGRLVAFPVVGGIDDA